MAAYVKISQDELEVIFRHHAEWLKTGGKQGKQAYLEHVFIEKDSLIDANLERGNLRNVNLSHDDGVHLVRTKLNRADLRNADLTGAFLMKANLSGANLQAACLRGAHIWLSDLSGVDLRGSDLTGASLIESSLQKAKLTGAHIYGISAWNLQTEGAEQKDLIISSSQGEATLTVDDIEVAQFVYLLRNNQKIRNVIDTITSKAVLILGRFTAERKQLLDALRDALRDRGFVPMLFDFQPSARRDLTETIQLLANMAKFVIADITEAKSIPQELSHIIPLLPSVPIQPILLASKREYAMFEHWRSFNTVLPEFLYEDEPHLIGNLEAKVILPADAWHSGKKNEVSALREKIKELEAKLAQDERR